MLRINLWVEGKLSNGSIGALKHIVYSRGTTPPTLPSYLLIQFDEYKGPYLQDKYFPIIPIQRSWTFHGIIYTRTQFPIAVAHSSTIHKAQGMSLPKVVIDIGDNEFAPGLTYVALSRARKLNDIMILKSYPKSRFDICAEKPSYILRNNFIKKYFSHTLN